MGIKLYIEGRDDEENEGQAQQLPAVAEGEIMENLEITATERFTQKPPRYSEASLVKKLEELGIGRPSTYAPTISTITQKRGYILIDSREGVEREYMHLTLKGDKISQETKKEITGTEKKKLVPQDIGILVTDFLGKNFENICYMSVCYLLFH